VIEFLREMGQLRWTEILRMNSGGHRKHHDQPIDTIVAEAQDDLRRHHLDEIFGDTMFRFRLSGTKRLWGFRVGRIFHAVWWDADHQVYPADPV
jgi:hypothetical protein